MIFLSCLILMIGLMAMDFINPSLPYIMHSLSASQNTTKGLMVTYLFAMSIAQLGYGTFSDNYGRRPAILISFIIAIIGFILSAISPNIFMLYVARFITAVGMAGSPVIARALIADVCHDDLSIKKAFAYFAMFSQISPATAPFFGGIIQHYASWRISFLALAFINIVTLIFLSRYMPESHTVPLVKKRVLQQIIVYFKLTKMRRFMIFCLLSSLIMAFSLGFYSLSPFIFHQMGFDSVTNGLMCIPYAFGLFSGAYLLSTLFHSLNSEKTFLAAMFSYLIFFLIMLFIFKFYINLWVISFFALIVGFLSGISSALSLSLCLQDLKNNRGAASAAQAFIRYFFCALVLFFCNFIHLTQFYQLTLIFLAISVLLLLLYGLERLFAHYQSITHA